MTNTSEENPDRDSKAQSNKLADVKTTTGPNDAAPETNGSKKTGNKNALSHGVYSKDIVLPFESQSDFEALVDDLRTEWRPRGRSEEEAVFDLAYVAWLKWRVRKWAQIRFHSPAESKSPYDNIIDKKSSELAKQQVQNPYKYAEFKDQADLLMRLDAQNDKILRRLTSLIVFKRAEAEVAKPPRQTESPPMAPTDPTETDVPLKTVETET